MKVMQQLKISQLKTVPGQMYFAQNSTRPLKQYFTNYFIEIGIEGAFPTF